MPDDIVVAYCDDGQARENAAGCVELVDEVRLGNLATIRAGKGCDVYGEDGRAIIGQGTTQDHASERYIDSDLRTR